MIYLLGGSGYVGRAYQEILEQKNVAFRSLSRAELNYADPATLLAALRADKPTFLINAAGYTGKPNVDACELHRHECLFGNGVLPGIIAGFSLVFIPALGEFVIPSLLGGPENLMIGRVVWDEMFTANNWPRAAALAVVMIGAIVVPLALYYRHHGQAEAQH